MYSKSLAIFRKVTREHSLGSRKDHDVTDSKLSAQFAIFLKRESDTSLFCYAILNFLFIEAADWGGLTFSQIALLQCLKKIKFMLVFIVKDAF